MPVMRLKQLPINEPTYLRCWHFLRYADLIRKAKVATQKAQEEDERAQTYRQSAKEELALFKQARPAVDSGLTPREQLEQCQQFILTANRRHSLSISVPAMIEGRQDLLIKNMERVRAQVPDAIQRASTQDDLLRSVGVTGPTLRKWRQEFPEFDQWYTRQVEAERVRRNDPDLFRHGRSDFGHSAIVKDFLRRGR